MPAKSPNKPSAGGRKSPGLGRRIKKAIVKSVERVDFVKQLDRIAASEAATPFRERFAEMPRLWQRQDELAELAADLAAEQLEAEGHEAERARLAEHVDSIRCRFDQNIYEKAVVSLTTVMGGIFQHADPLSPFFSADRREQSHLDTLREYQKQGLGVVYLVNHSSHLDEFLVDVVMQFENLGLPHFAAGDNMMAIESMAKILRAGAYTVRRRGAGRTYMACLFNYCRAISEMGEQQGIFLEAWHGGARTRDGSLRYPRRLVTLRGALAVQGDVVVQPVAVSYSAVPEDLPLAARGSARSWARGLLTPASLLNLPLHPRSWVWRGAQGIWGRAFVTFPRPWLLSELKDDHAAERSDLALDEYVALKSIEAIGRTKKVMASQLTARGLMRARRHQSADLNGSVAEELKRLTEYHQATFGCQPDLEDLIREKPIGEVVADGLDTLARRGVVSRLTKDAHGLPKALSPKGLAFYAAHGDRRLYSPTAKENLVVVGADQPGFAMVHHLGGRMVEDKRYLNASLTLFEADRDLAQDLGVERSPHGEFSEYRLPKNVFVTWDPPSAFKKASEVITTTPVEHIAAFARELLKKAEQGFNLVLASGGFHPTEHRLPYEIVRDLAAALGRSDVTVYTLATALTPAELVESHPGVMVLAGPAQGRDDLVNLFTMDPISVAVSDDPLGVQLAQALARAYGLWGGFLSKAGGMSGPRLVGEFTVAASVEALQLARALGARPETFSAASHAWLTALSMSGLAGPLRDVGRKLGQMAKKKGDDQPLPAKWWRSADKAGVAEEALRDLNGAVMAARREGLSLPILEEAHRRLYQN